jgi:hypothetical protein
MSRTINTFRESDSFNRLITLLSVDHLNEILPLPERAGRHFTMLLAMNGPVEASADLRNVPEDLLKEGLVYLCTWGPDCGRVHDVFGRAAESLNVRLHEEYNFRCTYHDNESLDGVLWFLLNAAIPHDKYAQSCESAFAVSVGSSGRANQLVLCLSDIRAFNRRILISNNNGN